ncbi:MAG: DUF4416 family protein [Planctomycetota bacterium]
MAEVMPVEPVIRFCAVISREPEIRELAIERLTENWGRIFLRSEPLPFEAGGYYAEKMGADLRKVLVGFERPVDSADLADWKTWSNDLENEFRVGDSRYDRPLNLDPGYVTQAKLVLATTKDRDHRIYLRNGIFAEITLTYTAKRWIHHRWSYPDYRTESVASFALGCRDRLRDWLQASQDERRIKRP